MCFIITALCSVKHLDLDEWMFVRLPDDTPVASAKPPPAESDAEGDGLDGPGVNGRLWRTVIIGEQEHRIDMQVIRPYLRVISHGGTSPFLKFILMEMTFFFFTAS